MDTYWFKDLPLSPAVSDDGALSAVGDAGAWAVLRVGWTHTDLSAESLELLSYYGGFIGQMGRLLSSLQVPLTVALDEWSWRCPVPTGEIKFDGPELQLVNGVAHPAFLKRYGRLAIAVSTLGDGHIVVARPTDYAMVNLVTVFG